MTVTAEQAEHAALKHLADLASDWGWEPAVTKVEDVGPEWRVHYNSRVYVETKSFEHALAGNLPLLIDKETGAVRVDETFAANSPRRRST